MCYQRVLDYVRYQNIWNMEEGLPEEKSQGLEKGLEVVVVIYGGLLVQLDVSKHLRQQERISF